MTTNADTVLSSVRKRTSSFMMALALLAVWSPSWAAESGQASGPAPGGLAVPPLTGEQTKRSGKGLRRIQRHMALSDTG